MNCLYDWLTDALQDSSHVLTASRRLARVLQLEYGAQQVATGKNAWRSPVILSLPNWLTEIIATSKDPQSLPTRINAHQGRMLWERCLRREINDPLLNIALLARQSMESWSRLHEWSVPLSDCADAAHGQDRRLFAQVAQNYQSILDRENWIDAAGLPRLATQLVSERSVVLPPAVTLAGFDRIVPQVKLLLDALRYAGCDVEITSSSQAPGSGTLHSYENRDAELRAAGAWARRKLNQSGAQSIAIIVSGLEQDAPRYARLVKEGLLPGWQYADSRYVGVVNVSYGRNLVAYPAIAIAALALRWLCKDLSSAEVSLLLRSPMLGQSGDDGRNRLELRLRQVPDRLWSPAMLLAELDRRHDSAAASDWLERVRALRDCRAGLPQRNAPSAWAALFDALLDTLNWPGSAPLNSREFQLINRWRELLNDFARLELVTPTMTIADALGQLLTMGKETVFQPEAEGAAVHLLGPLEAAGMQFDQLWIAGLSASDWPPAARPLALVSRDLQRSHGMPDADPRDTLDYAHRVISRLISSSPQTVCSYPQTDNNAEQTVTGLLAEFDIEAVAGPEDPHWHASQLVHTASIAIVTADPVPPVGDDETIAGGAATIQRQLTDPFSAFVLGRLGVRALSAITAGLAPGIRGNLIHGALHRLYADLPDSHAIAGWNENDINDRVVAALASSFLRLERNADPVLRYLLMLERRRVGELLKGVIAMDAARETFEIAGVENAVDAEINGIRLHLRYDRVDRVDGDQLVILDYKTGAPKRLLDRDGNPKEMQLVTYACAITDAIAGIGLVNIDTRDIAIDAAGRTFTPDLDWDAALSRWQEQVRDAAGEIRNGDVRINALQSIQDARPLSLLSRFRELRRDA